MAINLTTNYSKKLGLPGYSSHSFSASIEVEISSAADIPQEIARLYATLQQNVDQQILQPGFVPPGDYGMETNNSPAVATQAPVQQQTQQPANVVNMQQPGWVCSPKQRDLINKIIDERRIDPGEVELLADQRFAKPLHQLNKLEASGLIDLLFELYPAPRKQARKGGAR
ncbi:hypothetical protein Rhal01_03687 [Rubritalea halochordaticola]|uniref:DprA winged helix domain-containing protein n=1 Tax=Rubritalea halochordaticola TaxID=714537 RepID=A0ABP9V491_9BACT